MEDYSIAHQSLLVSELCDNPGGTAYASSSILDRRDIVQAISGLHITVSIGNCSSFGQSLLDDIEDMLHYIGRRQNAN